jgi:hypothetical protein
VSQDWKRSESTAVKVESRIMGLWFAGWLFTAGYSDFWAWGIWKVFLSGFFWPYILGMELR